jgi:hypothetical protein
MPTAILAAAEDERVQRLLGAIGYTTTHERERQFDASVARIRQHLQSPDAARVHASTLAQNFTAREATTDPRCS